MKKINCFVLCIWMCMVLFGCGGRSIEAFDETSQNTEKPTESQDNDSQADSGSDSKVTTDKATKSSGQVCIYICGCIKKPGVYNFAEGARVCDAIEAAGGYTSKADSKYWNQAQQMSDGMMIYVPSVDEKLEEAEQKDGSSNEPDDGKININTGTKEELVSIPGIGASRAESIIRYREENGNFSSIEDIMLVSGIGNSLFEKMREYITVN